MCTQECIKFETASLFGIFTKNGLALPDYQRPYAWKTEHVLALLKDLSDRKTHYLMGTVILHDTGDSLHIVDGQQRLVTLSILCKLLGATESPLLVAEFSTASHGAIANTRNVITEFLAGKDENEKKSLQEFLAGNHDAVTPCLLFNVLTLSGPDALDRAYTFFDSVNSKGKPLTDFDLLKAHHLSFIPSHQEALAVVHNDLWQGKDESHLHVFGTILRRLRMWARGHERDSKQERPDYHEFCSVVEPEDAAINGEHALNRYMQPAAFRGWRRTDKGIVMSMDYPVADGEALLPMEVNQSIEGGDPFFLYAKRYHALYESLFLINDQPLSRGIAFTRKLGEHIDNYYLRNAYQAIMLLYFDKFGEDRIIEIAVCAERFLSEKRKDYSVRIERVLTTVRERRLIPIILEAVNTRQVYSQLLPKVQVLSPMNSDVTGTRQRYRDRIIAFYRAEAEKLTDSQLKSVIVKATI